MGIRTKAALRQRRKQTRKDAIAAIASMSDDDLRNLRSELGRQYSEQANVLNEARVRLDAVRSEIERRATITTSGIHISDHAVVRYLERHKGMDLAAIREEIVGMAKRSGNFGSGIQYAQRQDEQTGVTLGLNEITNTVTTVFTERDRAVMEIDVP